MFASCSLLGFRYLIQSFWSASWSVAKNCSVCVRARACSTRFDKYAKPSLNFHFSSWVWCCCLPWWLENDGLEPQSWSSASWFESCRCKGSADPWTLLPSVYISALVSLNRRQNRDRRRVCNALSLSLIVHSVSCCRHSITVRTSQPLMRIRADGSAALGVWSPVQ